MCVWWGVENQMEREEPWRKGKKGGGGGAVELVMLSVGLPNFNRLQVRGKCGREG